MLSYAYYFLQVVFCSAVMMGYYWLVLRNKKFHQYNRFYLLSVLMLSWIIPVIKIQWTKPVANDQQVMNFLSIVADNNAEIDANIANGGYQWNWEGLAVTAYFTVAAVFLLVLVYGLLRLYALLKKHSCKNVGNVYLILTQVKGTPFSFFRYIFWHEAIDLRSDAGKKMLEHELTHVQQKHSIDKVLIQVVLVAGWFNPFFWLLKKEMEMIHEFIADKKSVQNGDSASLAQMLLTAAYPQQQFLLTNPFFFSPIKRRLQMISNNKNPRFSYLRRLVILPILALVVVLVAFRKKDTQLTLHPSIQLNKNYTIVIDAGHGGKDRGAMAENATVSESEIVLSLAKAVKEANANPNIKIVLSRETDVFNSVMEKADFANAQKADLFISLHCNTAELVQYENGNTSMNPSKGVEIIIADKEKANDYIANATLASLLENAIKNVNSNSLGIKSRAKGIWVLQAVKCPSALIEAGFMTNQDDLKMMQDAVYQKKLANSILEGAEAYLAESEKSSFNKQTLVIQDAAKKVTVSEVSLKELGLKKTAEMMKQSVGNDSTREPLLILDGKVQPSGSISKIKPGSIASMNVLKNEAAVEQYGEAGKNGVILITSKTDRDEPNKVDLRSSIIPIGEKTLYYLNGVKTDSDVVKKTDPEKILDIRIWKGDNAIMKFGEEGRYGVVEVTTLALQKQDTLIPAEFPGGLASWTKYLERNLKTNFLVQQKAPPGKYTINISFKVDENGSVSDVHAQNHPGYGASEVAENLIKKGPSWKPATQNGKAVASIRKQSISFLVAEKSK